MVLVRGSEMVQPLQWPDLPAARGPRCRPGTQELTEEAEALGPVGGMVLPTRAMCEAECKENVVLSPQPRESVNPWASQGLAFSSEPGLLWPRGIL